MFYAYVLRSLRNKKRYVGFTAKQPEERLEEHNLGSNKWARVNKPFKLVYRERLKTRQERLKEKNS